MRDLADATAAELADEDIAVGVDRDAARLIEAGRRGRAAVAAKAPQVKPVAPEPAIVEIVPPLTSRMRQLKRSAMYRLPSESNVISDQTNRLGTAASERPNWAAVASPPSPLKPQVPLPAMVVMTWVAHVDAANAAVSGVGDDDVAVRVDRQAGRQAQFGGGRRAAVAGVAAGAVAGDDRDAARGAVDPAHAAAVVFAYVKIAVNVVGGADGKAKAGRETAVSCLLVDVRSKDWTSQKVERSASVAPGLSS